MSNIIPPLLSDTPPPPPDVDEHDEDEFGDSIGTNNVSFDCDDGCSPPGSPLQLPVEPFGFDLNSNSKPSRVEQISELNTSKDFHDKRKDVSVIPIRSDQLFNAPSVNKIVESEGIIETNCDRDETFSSQSEIIKLSSEHFKDHQSSSDLSEPTSSVIVNGVDARFQPPEVLEELGDTSSPPDLQSSLEFENHPPFSAKPIENGLWEAQIEAPESPIKFADSEEDSEESSTDLFANFESSPAKPVDDPVDDEFSDFVAPQVAIPDFADFDSFPAGSADAEDDFGDFATTTIQPESQLDAKILLLNETEALEKAAQIVQEMFPPLDQSQPDFTFRGLEADDLVFNQIKNITDTHALSYHWAKSASQKLLLKSLSIDSRNIMFGPGWSSAMPRFASSLSVQPLEPIKSDILTPMSIKELSRSRTAKEPPTGAGLKTPEAPIASLAVKETGSAPTAEILELKESKCHEAKPVVEVQLHEFGPHLPPVSHSLVLRETHISNKAPSKSEDSSSDIVSWLEPTIVTPELIRKERQFVEGEEEFDDFQILVAEAPATSLTVKAATVEEEEEEDVGKAAAAEDEFGEFTFSVPKAVKSPPPPAPAALSLLEPLKPSIVPGQSMAPISWPDPGVTDDEISRFEALGYARTLQQEPPLASAKPPQKPDDEEWSDFVSVQNSSPIHKLKMDKERSSTPDLPLSVLNLGTVHPAKQPIPVITPNGLMQTKLSSSTPLNLANKAKIKAYTPAQAQFNHHQPSIISNQFASQAYGGFNSYQPVAPSLKASSEDDEWSDFVSHQPAAKPLQPHQPHQFLGWSGQKHGKKVPSAAVPDLDFLAPRNRTTHRK